MLYFYRSGIATINDALANIITEIIKIGINNLIDNLLLLTLQICAFEDKSTGRSQFPSLSGIFMTRKKIQTK